MIWYDSQSLKQGQITTTRVNSSHQITAHAINSGETLILMIKNVSVSMIA